MQRIFRVCVLMLGVLLLAGTTANAQDLRAQLAKLPSNALEGYATPMLNGWVTDLNSAFFSTADLHGFLGFDVSVKLATTLVKDEDKTYVLALPSTIGAYTAGTLPTNYPSSVTLPTAVGEKGDFAVKTNNGLTTITTVPGGFGLAAIGSPLVIPQLTVGLPFGLEVMGRYIPTIKLPNDMGKVNFVGGGLRYNVGHFIPVVPVDIAIHFMTQKLNLKGSDGTDFASATATAYGLSVSKKLLILTVYGAFQLESGKFTLDSYTIPATAGYLGNGQVAGFTVTEKNKSRATVGVRVGLPLVYVHAEYSFAKTNVAAAGIGVGL